MKISRPAAALAAAALALSLSACVADPEPPAEVPEASTSSLSAAPTTSRSVSPAATVEPAIDTEELRESVAERAYLSTVEDYTYPSTESALMVGRAACSLLDGGATPEELAAEVIMATEPVIPGYRNSELPNFYGAAMGSLCQEHMYLLEGY